VQQQHVAFASTMPLWVGIKAGALPLPARSCIASARLVRREAGSDAIACGWASLHSSLFCLFCVLRHIRAACAAAVGGRACCASRRIAFSASSDVR